MTCATSDQEALSGSDYTAVNELLEWGDGDSSAKECVIQITSDQVHESVETFLVDVSNPSGGAQLGTPNTATVDHHRTGSARGHG